MKVRQGELIGRSYRILDKLGTGGFSKTYLAVDIRRFNQQVVVKQLEIQQENNLEIAKAYFKKEAEALKKLGEKHDQIPSLIAYFEENGELYLVQEFVEGYDLTEELHLTQSKTAEAENLIDERTLIQIIIEVLEVLEFVHENNVIHRDIKPSNIRRRKDGKIVLIDFGAVKETAILNHKGRQKEERTRAIGTKGYMSPEQFAGFPKPASDIYGVGAIAIHALTGMQPIKICANLQTLKLEKVWYDFIKNNSNNSNGKGAKKRRKISNNFLEILDKTIAYDLKDRYQSAGEVLEDLRAIIKKEDSSTIEAIFLPNLERIKQKNLKDKFKKRAILLATGLGLAGAGLSWSVLYPILKNGQLERAAAACPVQIGDKISCGEEFLLSSSIKESKQTALQEAYENKDYQEILNLLSEVWQNSENKDPETLIYLQNILLEFEEKEYYTIAVVVPAGDSEFNTEAGKNLARDVLRGVAQAQLEVNSGVLDIENIKDKLPELELLPQNAIDGKGLKIVIVDDASSPQQARMVARELVIRSEIIGVVGHYSSQSTLAAIDIYNDPDNYLGKRYLPLPVISPGTATEELTFNPREIFARTVPNVDYHARKLVDKLLELVRPTKVAVFYNDRSDFSRSFFQEFQQEFRDREPNMMLQPFPTLHELDTQAQVSEILAQAKNDGVDAIVIFPDSYISDAVDNALKIITENAKQEEPLLVLGGWPLSNPKTLELGEEILKPLLENNKLILFVPWHRLDSPDAEFPYNAEKLWKMPVNSSPNALSYDATRAFILALEQNETPTRTSIQQIIRNGEILGKGATGDLEFKPANGDRRNPEGVFVHIIVCDNPVYGINNLAFVPLQFKTCQ